MGVWGLAAAIAAVPASADPAVALAVARTPVALDPAAQIAPALPTSPVVLPARAAPTATPWRALAEQIIALSIGTVGYAVTRPEANGAHPVSIVDKVRFASGAWGFDADSIATNYIGHPIAGFLYYQLARANHLGVGASLGMAVGTAYGWELAEYQELVSVHDILSGAAGALALGESFTQLAAWLAQRPGVPARALSILCQLPRSARSHLDGAPPPAPQHWGLADVEVWGGVGGNGPHPVGDVAVLRTGARVQLVREAAMGEPGRGWQALLDGNIARLSTGFAWGRPGLVAAEFNAFASAFGTYGREFDAAGHGWDLLAALGGGFDYLRRAVPAAGGWPDDKLALVRLPGVELTVGLRRGWLRAELGVEGAATLGGVTPLPLLGLPKDLPGAPAVLRYSGYYHALGAMVAPSVLVAIGPVELRTSVRFDWLQAITQRDVAPPVDGSRMALSDERRAWKLSVLVPTPWRGVQVRAVGELCDRWGAAAQQSAERRDLSALVALELDP